jgi:hypothetical protein
MALSPTIDHRAGSVTNAFWRQSQHTAGIYGLHLVSSFHSFTYFVSYQVMGLPSSDKV